MAEPYKCKRMRVQIVEDVNVYTLGVVEAFDIELIKEGGVVPHYDSETGEHAIGTRHATFSVRRWFKADNSNTDLIFDLFDGERHFNLRGRLVGADGSAVAGSMITLSDCVIYTYAPRTGGANDIVSEEGRGEARDWIGDIT